MKFNSPLSQKILGFLLLLSVVCGTVRNVHAAPGNTNGQRSANAPNGGDIRGQITRCGLPLGGAFVHIPGHSFLCKTDTNGRYELNYVQPGSYLLAVENGTASLGTINDVVVVNAKISDVGARDFCPDNDNDGFNASIDCNDSNPAIHPGATEACDGVDNDCNGITDEGCPACTDADNDGYFAQAGCGSAVDCNDLNSSINPQAVEQCADGIDNNCNGLIDENCLNCTPGATCQTSSPGACAIGVVSTSCACTPVHPPTAEICNGIDDNCNGAIDEDFHLSTDVLNCGSCGNACGAGQACSAGLCVAL